MKYAKHRHPFRFKVRANNGKTTEIIAWAKVIHGKTTVPLVLTADDVRHSMALHGVGNTHSCSMAVCTTRQSDAFPHAHIGLVDWQYSRAYVATKVGKNGLPCECVVYEHNSNIAKTNDMKGGQKKLLQELEVEGNRTITLHAPTNRGRLPTPASKPTGIRDGSRSSKPATLRTKGAKLRAAVAELGGLA